MPDESGARNVYGIEKATEPLHIECRCVGDAGLIGKSLTDHVWNKQSQPPAKRLDLMLPVPDGAGVAVQQDGRGPVTMPDVGRAVLVDADEVKRVAVERREGGKQQRYSNVISVSSGFTSSPSLT